MAVYPTNQPKKQTLSIQAIKPLSAILISTYGLFLRFMALNGRDLSGDEIFQLDNMKGAFKLFWQHHYYGDHTCFPGEYLLSYPFVQWFGPAKWGLAIPHIALTICFFYLFYRLCQRYFKTAVGFVIAFAAVALNANLIYHAFEFRPYAGLPALAVGSLFFAHRLIMDFDQLDRNKRWGIGLFYFFTTIYHAYGILLVLLPLVYVLGQVFNSHDRPIKVNRRMIRFLSVIAVISLAIWFWYATMNSFGLVAGTDFSPKDTFRYIPNPQDDPVGFLKGVVGNLVGFRVLYVFLAGPFLIWLLRGTSKWRQALFVMLLLLLPLGLILGTDLRSRYWFLPRQFIWLMPFMAFYLGWTWDEIIIKIRKKY